MSKCQCCRKEFEKSDLMWTYDRYGIPFKFVCSSCYDKEQNEISLYVHDFHDAGEYLYDY